MTSENKRVVYRRVRGRIIPFAVSGAGGMAAGTYLGSRGKKKENAKESPNRLLISLGQAANVASGLVAAIPFKSKRALFGSIAASTALDALSTSLLTKAVKDTNLSTRDKLKEFAKQQVIATSVGYSVFGGALLSQRGVRGNLMKAIRKTNKRILGALR